MAALQIQTFDISSPFTTISST